MNKCSICNVDIEGKYKNCPLCKNPIECDNKSENHYPKIPTVYEVYGRLFRWLLFATVAISLICITINLMFSPKILWVTFVLLGLGSSWILSYIAINRRGNLAKIIFVQSLLISILVILWDLGTGWHNWSIDFVLPIMYGVGLLSTFILGRILEIKVYDIFFYLILDMLLGLVPLILLLTGNIESVLPSIICVLLTVTSLILLIVFEGRNIFNEIKRRLHI